MTLILPRRQFIRGIAALLAPAVVKAESLMPVRSIGRLLAPEGLIINGSFEGWEHTGSWVIPDMRHCSL